MAFYCQTWVERLKGDIGLLRRLVDGDWNPDEFLVAQPGEKIVPPTSGVLSRPKPLVRNNFDDG